MVQRRASALWSGLRAGFILLAVTVVATAAPPAAEAANSRSAAIVVDASNGRVLYAENADAKRYPASLTKMMTLYVLFEDMSRGRFSDQTRFEVSAYAAGQSPTKLGLRPGQTITVIEAIKGLVTKSANDAAVVIAENVSGSEKAFASRMTATARRLGMANTVFRNANGLPNSDQHSTARDLATLGLALQKHYPERYRLFSTRSFTYRGRVMPNHNKLLGQVEGVDGIKTGYIRASGFNLVTSVGRDGRRLVAVVLGGSTGRERDNRMKKLIAQYLPKAQRSSMLVAAVAGSGPVVDTAAEVKATAVLAHALTGAPIATGEPVTLVTIVPLPVAAPRAKIVVAAAAPQAGIEQILAREIGVAPADAAEVPVTALVDPATAGPGTPPRTLAIAAAEVDPEAEAGAQGDAEIGDDVASTASIVRDGWKIQIAAMPDQQAAVAYLAEARTRVATLAAREPYTEAVQAGGTTLYRARFAGFSSQSQANAACAQLAKRNYDCLALRQ